MAKQKTFLILDGNALLHRAWHALPPTMTTSDGTVVNAAYGFTNILERMLTTLKPDYMAVAWDLPGKTFRHQEFAEYKATRIKKEQELYDQIPIIQDILAAYGIPSLSAEGFEADDVIGTIAEQNKRQKLKTLIVTGDMDALQLVDDATHGLFFVKGISETKTYDPAAVKERFGFSPEQLVDYKALAGDPSDNIKGVAGIGEKGAKELIAEFGSVEGIFKAQEKNPESIKPAMRKKLEGQKEHALKMKRLVTLVRDVKLGKFEMNDAKVKEPDKERLIKKFRELEFRTLLKKYETQDVGAIHELPAGAIPELPLPPQVIDGVTVGYDLKAEMHRRGERLQGQLFDLMVAAYLLNPGARGYELPLIGQQWLGRSSLVESDLMDLYRKLSAELKKENLTKVMEEIEMPIVPILYEMEAKGVRLDADVLAKLSKAMNADLEKLTKKIHGEAGREFNVNSPSQLAEILFAELNIPTMGIKRTKSGYSTAYEELEKIVDQHPIVPLMMEYRELAKLINTYVDALPSLIAKDGRLHTTFNQTVAATGRLSSSNPNLQNIPIRTEQGREIRKAFVADKGKVLLAADYSQIELRIAAVIAGDQPFIEAFKEGADIHTRTAAEVWGVAEDAVTKDQRRAAKAVNFGILYGMGPRNLAKSTGLSLSEAKAFIEKYFQIHQAIKKYIDETKAQAHAEGFVATLFGRKRYFSEINSGVQMLVAQAERMAVNMPIQGAQADLIKLAMAQIDEWVHREKVEAHLLLQVHDELVFEVKQGLADEVGQKIKSIMEQVVDWEVPVVAEVKTGASWGEME